MKVLPLVLSLIFVSLNSNSLACSYDYRTTNYVVLDCEKLENGKLGEFVQSQLKAKRDVSNSESCLKMPVEFFSKNSERTKEKSNINAQRVAGAFIYNYYTSPNKVFWGISDTLAAIRNERTLNIVIDGGLNFFVMQLQNTSYDGHVIEKIISSDDLSKSFIKSGFRIVHCENMFAYLQREIKNPKYSITVTNSQTSNPEYRFKLLSSGLGGFYSRHWLQRPNSR